MKKYLLVFLLFFPLMVLAKSDKNTSTTFQAGRDYLVLPVNHSTEAFNPKNKITVVEFFSFGCPACYRLNPVLDSWIQTKPSNVDFQRIPVIFESDWHLYARAYYVAKNFGIQEKVAQTLFDGLHKDRLDLGTPERMADFFQKRFDIKTKDFMNTYESPVIQTQLKNNQKITNDFMVFQIPGVVVDGKYKVDPSLAGNNPQRLIDILNFLIQKEKKEKSL